MHKCVSALVRMCFSKYLRKCVSAQCTCGSMQVSEYLSEHLHKWVSAQVLAQIAYLQNQNLLNATLQNKITVVIQAMLF